MPLCSGGLNLRQLSHLVIAANQRSRQELQDCPSLQLLNVTVRILNGVDVRRFIHAPFNIRHRASEPAVAWELFAKVSSGEQYIKDATPFLKTKPLLKTQVPFEDEILP